MFIFLVLSGDELKNFIQSTMAFSLGMSNVLFQVESNYFTDFAIRKPLLHTWSLSLEVQFYCFTALMILLSRQHLVRFVLGASIASFILYLYFQFANPDFVIPYSSGNSSAIFFNPVFRLWEFGLGFVAWVLFMRTTLIKTVIFNATVAVAIVMSVLCFFLIKTESAQYGSLAIFVSFGTVWMLISGKHLIPTSGLLTRLGNSSYVLYLMHFPILFILEWYDFITPFWLCMGILVCLILADFVTKRVEPKLISIFRKNSKALILSPIIVVALLSVYLVSDFSKYEYPKFIEKERQVNRERLILIDSVLVDGSCQYFEGAPISLTEFIEGWGCYNPRYTSYIFGDSTAADLKMALVEYGHNVGHLGGAGCSVDPKFMSFSCKKLFSSAIQRLNDRQNDDKLHIILRQRFEGRSLSKNSLNRIREFWTIDNSVIVTTPFPIEAPRMKGIYRKMANRGESPELAFNQLSKRPYDESIKMIAGDYWGNNLNEEYFDPDQYFYLDKLSLLTKIMSFS